MCIAPTKKHLCRAYFPPHPRGLTATAFASRAWEQFHSVLVVPHSHDPQYQNERHRKEQRESYFFPIFGKRASASEKESSWGTCLLIMSKSFILEEIAASHKTEPWSYHVTYLKVQMFSSVTTLNHGFTAVQET